MADLSAISATLSFSIEETSRDYPTLSYKFVDGKQQKLSLRATKMRTWTLHFLNQSPTQATALRSFWDTSKGEATLNTWTNPETSETSSFYFVGEWSSSWDSPVTCTVTLKIEETAV